MQLRHTQSCLGTYLESALANVLLTFGISALILIVMAFVYRPLLFASLDEDVAEAKGMNILLLGMIFMVLLAAAVSIAIQVTGVLLIFALMVTPAATAIRLTKKPVYAIVISVADCTICHLVRFLHCLLRTLSCKFLHSDNSVCTVSDC